MMKEYGRGFAKEVLRFKLLPLMMVLVLVALSVVPNTARAIAAESMVETELSEISILVGQDLYYDSSDFYYHSQDMLTISNVVSSDPSVVDANLITHPYNSSINNSKLQGIASGTANISFEVEDTVTHEIKSRTIVVNVAKQAPYLDIYEAYPFVGSEFRLGVDPNSDWTNNIIEITNNGEKLSTDSYTITPGVVDEKDGEIVINAGVLSEGQNQITVKANGYADAISYIYIGRSEQTFYMNEPVIETSNNILNASVQVVKSVDGVNYYNQKTAVFQLMDGNVPIETLTSEEQLSVSSFMNYAQTFSVEFDLTGLATGSNHNYSVRAFIISGDNTDENNLGYHLATEVNAEDFEAHYQEWVKSWD